MRLLVLLVAFGLMMLAACGDTTSPEPAAVSDSANANDLDATVEARVQATIAAQPTATSTPQPTKTPAPTATHTPAPAPTATLTYEEYFELGVDSYENDEIDNAIINLSKAIELNPGYVDAYYFRGLVYIIEEDYDKGIADFEKVVELDPEHTDAKVARIKAYSDRGLVYFLEEDYDKSIADFDRAIELAPDHFDAYYRRGLAFVAKEDYDSAISNFDRDIELNPDYPDTYYSRGNIYLDKDDYDRAIADFDKAIEIDPDYADVKALAAYAYLLRGIGYTGEGDLDRAIADYEKAVELEPEYADARREAAYAYLRRGIGYAEEGDLDRAIADYEKAVELEPEYADARREAAYAYLRRGIVYTGEGDLDRAIADYERAVELEPDNVRVRNARKFIEPSLVSDEFSAERIEWSLCKGILECGFVEVPADYRNPDAGSIKIAVNVRRADSPNERIGYLFVNPGGPGGSGLELVQGSEFVFADELIARFDIIGFDPRGVGESEPKFACGAPGEQLALLATIDGEIDTPDEIATGEAAANLCIESMGPVGALLHSEYVVRDMDEIRKALGTEQISYLGFSYGSALGAWYATLFPRSVRAMVVDGADNPVDKAHTQQERMEEDFEETAPIEENLKRALTACDSAECPIYNDGDPIGYYYRAAEKLHLVNSAAGGVPDAAFLGVITPLYNEEEWLWLWQGLHELQEDDDPTILLEFAMRQLNEEPTAANFTSHVNCLDGFALEPELDRATRLDDSVVYDAIAAEKFPLIEAADSDFPSACLFYDQFAPEPLDVPLDGGGVPILVVGNHDDPATSFGESEELVTEVLSNGYLLETSHARHVVYPDNECVNDHVHRALIDLEFPDERRVFCERED